MKKCAVILFNLGGPDSLDAVEPFLYNLFCDPDIFNLPFGQKILAKIISSRRAPKIIKEYKLLGGNSPINEWTEKQRALLETELRKLNSGIDVHTAMRYWNPITKDTALKVEKMEYDRIILLPLYPHYSITTTGSSFNEWNRQFKGKKAEQIQINNYFDHPSYIAAVNRRIDEAILRFPEEVRKEIQLVFSAHGTPVSLVKKGDPYSSHIKATVDAVMKMRGRTHKHHLCYQSKVGPIKWLEPSTADMISDLSAQGKKHLLIIPVSFVSDHVETLFELDIQYREIADKILIKNYIVMEGLNDSPLFISALKELVEQHL